MKQTGLPGIEDVDLEPVPWNRDTEPFVVPPLAFIVALEAATNAGNTARKNDLKQRLKKWQEQHT